MIRRQRIIARMFTSWPTLPDRAIAQMVDVPVADVAAVRAHGVLPTAGSVMDAYRGDPYADATDVAGWLRVDVAAVLLIVQQQRAAGRCFVWREGQRTRVSVHYDAPTDRAP